MNSPASVFPFLIKNQIPPCPQLLNMLKFQMPSLSNFPLPWDPKMLVYSQMMMGLPHFNLAAFHHSHSQNPKIEEASESSVVSKTQTSPSIPLVRPIIGLGTSESQLENHIKYMIQFFIENYGRTSEQEIQIERSVYSQDDRLCKIFDLLCSKYSSIIKTREQRIKWIIRRALKTTKKAIIGQKGNFNKGEVSKKICKRYFKGAKEESPSDDEDNIDYGNLLESLLPFKKKSKNKTMNATFLSEIFESEQFRHDYKIFLEEFDETIEKDIEEKKKRFVSFVVECVKKGNLDSIKKYKRVPWLRVWFQNTKKLAIELAEENQKTPKILKKEE